MPTRPTFAPAAARTSSPACRMPMAGGASSAIIGESRSTAWRGSSSTNKRRKPRSMRAMSTEEVIRDREELSEQIRALDELQAMATSYGFDIAGPAADCARGGAMAILRLPRRRQGTERRGHVARPHLDVSRHLFRARPGRRHADRGAGAGDHRRLCHQAADRALPAHARVRRAVCRRPYLGDGVDRRHGRRRAPAGDQNQLPVSAHAARTSARRRNPTSPSGIRRGCRTISDATRPKSPSQTQCAAIRERLSDARCVGRRRRDRLLRLAHARGQADAVLRRTREPRQVPALRHQRRARRNQRQTGRPAVEPVKGDYLDFDDVAGEVRANDGMAGAACT